MVSMLPTISEQFANANLAGTYAITGVGWGGQAQTASVGVFTFDGDGNVSGSSITNAPGSTFGKRVLVDASIQGNYNFNEDGSGFGSTDLLYTLASGSTREIQADFLVTKAQPIDGVKIVQEFFFLQQTVDPVSGSLMMYSATRHPSGGKFSLASFYGTYGGPGIARGNQTPAAALGIGAVNFDGDGSFTGVDIQNLPAERFDERRIATFHTSQGKYIVNKDGTGAIIGQDGSQAAMVITKAKVIDGIRVCLEYFFVTNDLLPSTGNLVTTFITKRLP